MATIISKQQAKLLNFSYSSMTMAETCYILLLELMPAQQRVNTKGENQRTTHNLILLPLIIGVHLLLSQRHLFPTGLRKLVQLPHSLLIQAPASCRPPRR